YGRCITTDFLLHRLCICGLIVDAVANGGVAALCYLANDARAIATTTAMLVVRLCCHYHHLAPGGNALGAEILALSSRASIPIGRPFRSKPRPRNLRLCSAPRRHWLRHSIYTHDWTHCHIRFRCVSRACTCW